MYLTEIKIEGFRGVRSLNLSQISQFNLLVGQNNSGKTSVLEAIELFCHPLDITQFALTSRSRDRVWGGPSIRLPILESAIWLFPYKQQEDSEKKKNREDILIEGNVNGERNCYKASYTEEQVVESIPTLINSKSSKNLGESSEEEVRALEVKLEFFKEGQHVEAKSEIHLLTDHFRLMRDRKINSLFESKMVTPVDHRVLPISARQLSKTVLSGDKNKIIELLQKFDRNIEGFEVLSPDGRIPVPYLKHKLMGYAPVSVFGDGVRRVLTIAAAILQCRNGILLIDEIETAVHTKLFEKFFNWLVSLCKVYNVQLFATTHSLETIDAILAADKESLEDLMAYRLEINENITSVKKFSGQDLFDLRYELGQDVR